MALETGTYISSLIASNPTAGDNSGQGDDHIRLIKSILLNTFPTANRLFQFDTSIATQTSTYAPHASNSDGLIIPMDARAAARQVTLPASPGFDGLRMRVIKADHSINKVTISGNGNLINGYSTLVLHQRYQSAELIWAATTSEWFAVVDQIPEVGSELFYSGSNTPVGYVPMGGVEIGNGSSAAAGRANADCLALFQHLWNTYNNTICPVSGGRGASALADFDANKKITLLSVRGRAIIGKDDLGGTAADLVTNSGTGNSGIAGNSLGASGGAQSVSLIRTDLPNFSLTSTGSATGGAHDHFMFFGANTTNSLNGSETPTTQGDVTAGNEYILGGSVQSANTGKTGSSGSLTLSASVTGAVNGGVTQTAHNNMPPVLVQNIYLKL